MGLRLQQRDDVPVSDYSHHNEEARQIWWQEEGRYDGLVDDAYEDPYYDDDYWEYNS